MKNYLKILKFAIIPLLFSHFASADLTEGLKYDERIELPGENVEVIAQVVFTNISFDLGDHENLYLYPVDVTAKGSHTNPDPFILIEMCRDLTDGAADYYATSATLNSGETVTMTAPRPFLLFGGLKIISFKNSHQCGPWESQIADFPRGTSYIRNLICIKTNHRFMRRQLSDLYSNECY